MTYPYTFQTPEHGYDFVPVSGDLVRIQTEDKEPLEEFLNTLELAGMAERQDVSNLTKQDYLLADIEIEEGSNEHDTFFFIEITKADLALYLQFEVLNYLGAASV